MPAPFSDPETFGRLFADGLDNLLAAHRGLGAYILVLANAAHDRALWPRFVPALARRHAELADTLRATLRRGEAIDEPDDDLMVFLKLDTIGFDHLGHVESRRDAPWHALFNPLRALRPPRASGQCFNGLLRPFAATGFHFNKPFLARETLWHGELGGKPARLLYNKFPFAHQHGLLVPEPERCLPQMLTPELHGWAWDVCRESGVPGCCLGYNSTGAGASVNHLHFQSFVREEALPVEDARFAHNGGELAYPLPCLRLTDAESAWRQIDGLHRRDLPYNLLYTRDALYCIARVPHDDPRLEGAIRGYGWSEMAGVVTLFSRQAYETWNADAFGAALAHFAP